MIAVNGVDSQHNPGDEYRRIVEVILAKKELRLPFDVEGLPPIQLDNECDTASFSIPFKEIETTAALKAIKAAVAASLASLRYHTQGKEYKISIAFRSSLLSILNLPVDYGWP
jgi:hypothetical protein